MTLELVASFAGASVLVSLLVEVVKRAWDPPADVQDRFMPIIAMVIGVVVVVAATMLLGPVDGELIGNAVLTGVFSGLAACGLYDAVQGVRGV